MLGRRKGNEALAQHLEVKKIQKEMRDAIAAYDEQIGAEDAEELLRAQREFEEDQ